VKKVRQSSNSPIYTCDATPRPILMNFGTLSVLNDIIIYANFGVDQFLGFRLVRI
jgi:hypothetical protein